MPRKLRIDNIYSDSGEASPIPTPKIRVPDVKQLEPIFTTLVCRQRKKTDDRNIYSWSSR